MRLATSAIVATALTWAWLGALYLGYTHSPSAGIFNGVFGYYRPVSEVVVQTTIAGLWGLAEWRLP